MLVLVGSKRLKVYRNNPIDVILYVSARVLARGQGYYGHNRPRAMYPARGHICPRAGFTYACPRAIMTVVIRVRGLSTRADIDVLFDL